MSRRQDWCSCFIKLKFHGTDTDTNTDTDFLADFRAMILARKSACPARAEVAWQSACSGARSRPTAAALAARSARRQSPRTFVRRALFLARMSVGDARVYTCTRTVHDKLSCTHLQNYTIGASLKSVPVSVPWNLSLITRNAESVEDYQQSYNIMKCELLNFHFASVLLTTTFSLNSFMRAFIRDSM